MYLPITTLSACALALLLVVLSFRIIGVRRDEKVSLGNGGNDALERRIRAHGNLAEYAPMGLILIALAEIQEANTFLLGCYSSSLCNGQASARLRAGFYT